MTWNCIQFWYFLLIWFFVSICMNFLFKNLFSVVCLSFQKKSFLLSIFIISAIKPSAILYKQNIKFICFIWWDSMMVDGKHKWMQNIYGTRRNTIRGEWTRKWRIIYRTIYVGHTENNDKINFLGDSNWDESWTS